MENYIDYKFYANKYKGNLPEAAFEKLSLKASLEVRNAIMNKSIEEYKEEVQLATCSVTDILYIIELAEQRKAKLLSSKKEDKIFASEQVANVSRTLANSTSIKEIEQEISNQKAKINEEIEKYLAFTGLLYRGI